MGTEPDTDSRLLPVAPGNSPEPGAGHELERQICHLTALGHDDAIEKNLGQSGHTDGLWPVAQSGNRYAAAVLTGALTEATRTGSEG